MSTFRGHQPATAWSSGWGILVPAGLGAVLGILAFQGDRRAVQARPGLAYAVLGLIIGSAYRLWPDGLGGPAVIVALAFVAGARPRRAEAARRRKSGRGTMPVL